MRTPARLWNGHEVHRCRWCAFEGWFGIVERHERQTHRNDVLTVEAVSIIEADQTPRVEDTEGAAVVAPVEEIAVEATASEVEQATAVATDEGEDT